MWHFEEPDLALVSIVYARKSRIAVSIKRTKLKEWNLLKLELRS